MRVTIAIYGQYELGKTFKSLKSIMTRDSNMSAWNQAQHLFARSRAVVPYEYGTLYDAAFIANTGDKDRPEWTVGYNTYLAPHALYVHEIPAEHPTRGPSPEAKQDHFLSEPRDAMVKTYPRAVANDLRAGLKRLPIRRMAGR